MYLKIVLVAFLFCVLINCSKVVSEKSSEVKSIYDSHLYLRCDTLEILSDLMYEYQNVENCDSTLINMKKYIEESYKNITISIDSNILHVKKINLEYSTNKIYYCDNNILVCSNNTIGSNNSVALIFDRKKNFCVAFRFLSYGKGYEFINAVFYLNFFLEETHCLTRKRLENKCHLNLEEYKKHIKSPTICHLNYYDTVLTYSNIRILKEKLDSNEFKCIEKRKANYSDSPIWLEYISDYSNFTLYK